MTDLFGNQPIRALSWKPPYGSLMLHGKIETRTWDTSYRGLVLICASQKAYSLKQLKSIAGIDQVWAMIFKQQEERIQFHHGHAIAIGELVDCRLMTIEDEEATFVKYREPWQVLSDRKGGPVEVTKRLWCHIYKNVKPIKPFPFKGAQGWKILSPDKHKDILDQIQYL